jgi:hypothetical protein
MLRFVSVDELSGYGQARNECLAGGIVLPGNFVRLQVVQQRSNPLRWRLLKHFGERARSFIGENVIQFVWVTASGQAERRSTQLFLLRHRCSCDRQFCLIEISSENSARLSRFLEGFLELAFQLCPWDLDESLLDFGNRKQS